MSELKYRYWEGECVNDTSSKFYRLIAVSKGTLMLKVVAVSGKIGLPGIAQPIKELTNLELDKFISSKLKRGYRHKDSQPLMPISYEAIKERLEKMTKNVKGLDDYMDDWMVRMIGTGDENNKAVETKAESKTKAPIDYSKEYGDEWGAWA